jgi:hypothetical protein
MKINGINLHSTFPGEIQLLGTYDTVGVCDAYCMAGRELKLGSEFQGFSFKFQGFRDKHKRLWGKVRQALSGFVRP